MNNLLKCIGFKGYNFCEEPLQPKENFYENDIKRKFYQCKKCRISRQKYIAAYIKTRLSLWKNDARVGLWANAFRQALTDLQEQDDKDSHSGNAMRVMNIGGYY